MLIPHLPSGVFSLIVFPTHGTTCICANVSASGSGVSQPLHSMPVCSRLHTPILQHNELDRHRQTCFLLSKYLLYSSRMPKSALFAVCHPSSIVGFSEGPCPPETAHTQACCTSLVSVQDWEDWWSLSLTFSTASHRGNPKPSFNSFLFCRLKKTEC